MMSGVAEALVDHYGEALKDADFGGSSSGALFACGMALSVPSNVLIEQLHQGLLQLDKGHI
jgi:hypothetical protein